jgi:hypothetical protein
LAGTLALALPFLGPDGVSAQDAAAEAPAFSLELNNAEAVDGGCRLTYVAHNGTGTALDTTSYEVVVFDGQNRVAQFLILDFGKLPQNKTKVVQFDLAGRPCTGISRLLVNEIADCVAGGQTVPICLDALKTTSRTSIQFGM